MVDLNNKNILVTGGNGFIGSNFIELLLRKYNGSTIVNLDKMGVGSRSLNFSDELLGNNTFFTKKVDLRLLNDMYLGNIELPNIEYDYVFHFAAESHVDRSINSPLDFISNNVVGTTSLLDYIKDHQSQSKVVIISTDEVFGHLTSDELPFIESSCLKPRSPYAASKAAGDLIALAYCSTYGLDISVTRCCNNYGPNQHKEKFIPTVLRSLKEKKKIPVYGNGKNIREWIYVDDHNESILEIAGLNQKGLTYNIGSGVEKSNLELVSDLIRLGEFGGELEDHIEFVEDRKGHDFRYAIDTYNYERNFELVEFDAGILQTIRRYH